VAWSYGQQWPVVEAFVGGDFKVVRDGLVVILSRLLIALPDTSSGVAVAFVRVGTDFCGGTLFPFSAPNPAEVAVEWSVPAGNAELTGRLFAGLNMPPTDPSRCRLRIQLLDQHRTVLTTLETFHFLQGPSQPRVIPLVPV